MIDAHVHVWRLGENGCLWPPAELAAIHRDHELDELSHVIAGTGVARIILVQSQESEADTTWLLGEAAAAPIVAGVVGWVDVTAGDAVQRIAQLAKLGPLVGVRVMAQDRAPEWLAAPALHLLLDILSERNLACDLLVRPHHLATCAALATRFPMLRIVIDHGAKPQIAAWGFAAWRDAIASVAAYSNTYCKLSGLVTEAAPDQPLSELEPYIATMLDLFGPERLIWGSDWPVLNLAADYRGWLDFARAAIPAAHQAAVFGGNARACYRLAA